MACCHWLMHVKRVISLMSLMCYVWLCPFAVVSRHAVEVLRNWKAHERSLAYCKAMHSPFCCVDENLVQTLVAHKFPHQVANRSVMSVEWNGKAAHPRTYKEEDVTPELLEGLRRETADRKHKNIGDLEQECFHNGKPSGCWLFARKFAVGTVRPLMRMAEKDLLY